MVLLPTSDLRRFTNTASAAALQVPPGNGTLPVTGTTTITSLTAGFSGQQILLEFAASGCRVAMGGNLRINGDYLSTANGILALVANGSNWEEITRSSATLQPYNAHPNGGFEVWQRGTSFVSPASATYLADRWRWDFSGAGAVTITQDTDVPAVAANAVNSPFSMKVAVTTADTSIISTDAYYPMAIIEGYDYRALTNGFAVSFWVKAAKTGTYCVSFRNRGGDRSYVAEYQITLANTWQYQTCVVPTPPTAGTWNYTNGIGLLVDFALAAGSGFFATPGAWATGNLLCTTNQVNGMDSVANNFWLWGLNIVPGTIPQPYQPMPFALQLTRLERYYEVLGGTGVAMICRSYDVTAGHAIEQYYIFHTKKGGTPTVTRVGTWILTNVTAQPAVEGASPDGFSLYSFLTVGGQGNFYCNDATTYVTAEWNPA